MKNLHEQMIISALRYALERRTYITDDTEEYITKMIQDGVSYWFLGMLVEDLSEVIGKTPHDWSKLLALAESKIK